MWICILYTKSWVPFPEHYKLGVVVHTCSSQEVEAEGTGVHSVYIVNLEPAWTT